MLEAIGTQGENIYTAHERLGIKISTVNSHLTKIFQKYQQAVNVVDEYGLVFDGRSRRHKENLMPVLLRLRKLTK